MDKHISSHLTWEGQPNPMAKKCVRCGKAFIERGNSQVKLGYCCRDHKRFVKNPYPTARGEDEDTGDDSEREYIRE
jgi:DNA-directed RNA polymerase subunit RPC12/RpoP